MTVDKLWLLLSCHCLKRLLMLITHHGLFRDNNKVLQDRSIDLLVLLLFSITYLQHNKKQWLRDTPDNLISHVTISVPYFLPTEKYALSIVIYLWTSTFSAWDHFPVPPFSQRTQLYLDTGRNNETPQQHFWLWVSELAFCPLQWLTTTGHNPINLMCLFPA